MIKSNVITYTPICDACGHTLTSSTSGIPYDQEYETMGELDAGLCHAGWLHIDDVIICWRCTPVYIALHKIILKHECNRVINEKLFVKGEEWET